MNFSSYQTQSRKTATYPAIGHSVIYPTLGLTNEAIEKLYSRLERGAISGDGDNR
jgi:hypothetical protein